jgi:hypothetical protein
MTQFSEESLGWLDKLEIINASVQSDTTLTQTSFVDKLKISPAQASYLYSLKDCLDQAAIAKVRQAAQANPPYVLSFTSAKALVGLKKKKVADLHGLIHAALDVIFALRLDTRHIKALVDWIASGKPVSEFDPKAKPPKALVEPNDSENTEDEDEPEDKPVKTKPKKGKASSDDPSWDETLLLDWLADISLIAQIKSKIKKHKSPSTGEVILLGLHKLGEIVGHLIKLAIKLIKILLKLAKLIRKVIIDALKEVGLYKYLKAAFIIVILLAVGWFIWETHQYGMRRPIGVIESFLFKRSEDSPIQEVPTQVPQSPISMGLGQSKHVSRPVVSTQTYQPAIAWQASDEDQAVLDTEIAALPVNCVVKDFPLTPDEGMPGDLAVSRLQNLTDPDKYTMKIGKDTQKILSVNATTTNLILNYKSTDPLALDGSGPMNLFWEDVIMIHVDEIDVQGKKPKVIYQCSLIVSGAKEPLTIQCSTPADLKHLVSTLEYFIRDSRLGHDAQPGGMPYPAQGLRLNDDCQVAALWANSPAGRTGIVLGDMVWSLDINGFQPPSRKDLETRLASLASGQHRLYIVSPADRDKAIRQMKQNHAKAPNPQRSQVSLVVS